MHVDLPPPLSQYFADGERTASAPLFSENAVVLDEGHVHRGRAEIAVWLESVDDAIHGAIGEAPAAAAA